MVKRREGEQSANTVQNRANNQSIFTNLYNKGRLTMTHSKTIKLLKDHGIKPMDNTAVLNGVWVDNTSFMMILGLKDNMIIN